MTASSKQPLSNPPLAIILLAAGLGKRMKSTDPKVIQPICGRPMIVQMLSIIHETFSSDVKVAIIVGHGREKVESLCKETELFKNGKLSFILQPEQLGTGHAARCAMDSPWGDQVVKENRKVLILAGDSPLLTAELLIQSTQALTKGAALRLVSTFLENPTGYGRVVRQSGKNGSIKKIVEEKDASPKEKQIQEVSASFYLFEAAFLQKTLRTLKPTNAQKEYYLTDVVTAATRLKKKIDSLVWEQHLDLMGINDLWELASADQILMARILKKAAKNGTRLLDPSRIRIEATVELEPGVVLHPGVSLEGQTSIGSGTVVGPNVTLKNVKVGKNAEIKQGTVAVDSVIGDSVALGPYAHLRPESQIGNESKIGNFVELKKTKIGSKTSVAHLSYLGDAEVGSQVNIGCGFVTCNFDGRVIDGSRKHKTIIEDGVFMGSDCQTIAPVRIGKNAYVASGSTITENVESESLAIARSRQVNKPGYAKKLKEK